MTLGPSECRAVLAEGSKSFNFASRFLPAERRNDAAVVYTFCRTVDDIADEAASPSKARDQLMALREELVGVRQCGQLAGLFLRTAQQRGFSAEPAIHLIDGVTSDLDLVRIQDDVELLRYCYRVAGTVGLLMCGVLGVRAPRAAPFAVDLGIAMQLTNICRDVREDAKMGRAYIPRTRLDAENLTPEQVVEGAFDRDRLASVVADLLALADLYYRSADDGMRFIPLRTRLAIQVASRVYRGIGVKLLSAHSGDSWRGRTVVSGLAKAGWAAGALTRTLDPTWWGLWSLPRHDPRLHGGLEDLPGTNGPDPVGLLAAGV